MQGVEKENEIHKQKGKKNCHDNNILYFKEKGEILNQI